MPGRLAASQSGYVNSPSSGCQITFDVVAGIVAPIACLVFDPIVFRSPGPCFGSVGLNPYAIFAYSAIGLGILTLAAWLAGPERLQRLAGLIAGILFAGVFFAAGLGILMLPYSLPACIIGVGALGFIPFVTAWVYLRHALRALRCAFAAAPRPAGPAVALLIGVLAVIAIPAFLHWQVPRVFPQLTPPPVIPYDAEYCASV